MDNQTLRNKTILIISPEAWGTIRLSKHHYATELAKNNTVYFLNPFSNSNNCIEIQPGLSLVNYKGIKGLNRIPIFLSTLFQKKFINKIHTLCNLNSFDIIWSFDPYSFQNLNLWRSKLTIYHAMDHHKTPLEKSIAKSSNFIFAPSELILNKFKFSDSNDQLFKINHGLAETFCSTKVDYIKNDCITIGYVGNLTSQVIRLDLIAEIIKNHPEIEFTLIGPIGKSNISNNEMRSEIIDSIVGSHNVIHKGTLAPETYQIEINKLDGFIVCYDADPISISNSHKILEYLSTGKAIFSGPIDEYINQPDLVNSTNIIEDLPKDFKFNINNIEQLNSTENMQKRISYALDNTYAKQIDRIAKIIYKSTVQEKDN